jgi:hypothetical protein
LIGAKLFDALSDGGGPESEYLSGKNGGILRAPDGDRRHRNASGHLHDGQQRVQSSEILCGDGNPDHRQRSLRRQHSGKMGGPAGARNDDLDAPVDRLFRVGEETIGSPVGGDHQELVGNPEFVQHGYGLFQNREVRLASAQDPDRSPDHGVVL